MKRRHFLGLAGLTGIVGALPGISFGFPRLDLEASPELEKLELSKEEWRERLSDEAYNVLRDHGTEPAFSSSLDKESGEGEYRCAGCDLLLFTSEMKYDSGTGWPSFFEHVEGHMLTELDFKLVWPRTEYHCARCGGHQGHVFEDGPDPTGLRWCNNGVALRFVPA
ncbi:peptide-methionine (R)-S-oxide reductase MsrB [Vreelandella neptunia]|uniref:peptide-methionine (R)-S-oxide reductase n=1 Tax=Vreelandella neptunia TaxID=115551 RepID=A0ABS9S1G2_9GAMM|nr:peptide-methionine (R)-S-oxide reductase MsrB [Halomonas neptunia]MCH4809954.1 peptide-methionine (R)-S-oxide reductase MsrB [Halomonas neptunia]